MASLLQHEPLHPLEHGEDPGGVGQPVVRHRLDQAGVDHPEGVGQTLQSLHGVLVGQVIPGKNDPYQY